MPAEVLGSHPKHGALIAQPVLGSSVSQWVPHLPFVPSMGVRYRLLTCKGHRVTCRNSADDLAGVASVNWPGPKPLPKIWRMLNAAAPHKQRRLHKQRPLPRRCPPEAHRSLESEWVPQAYLCRASPSTHDRLRRRIDGTLTFGMDAYGLQMNESSELSYSGAVPHRLCAGFS